MTKNEVRRVVAIWFWDSWGWFAVCGVGAALIAVVNVTGWNPFPGHHLALTWFVGTFVWSLWWLAGGAAVAAIALWVLVGLIALVASLLLVPPSLVGIPSAVFFASWAIVTIWDPAKRLWQRANAWLTWPLFLLAVPTEDRDRYRRYRDTTNLPALASFGEDIPRKVSELRGTAERVRGLEAPSQQWRDVRSAVSDGCELWADMLEGKQEWDGSAVVRAFARRDASWEALFHHLSPWGWSLLMWGPARGRTGR